ncbi:MAG: alkaline phosphatase [Spirochaetes bacterium]|nr:alkaline phosphatase [Spirochaetota bacterium]
MIYSKTFPKIVISVLFIVLFFEPSYPKTQKKETQKEPIPKNIIIMIGDGMGIGAISAYYLVNTNANISRFKNVGLMTTHADGSLITDSGAGGTALATGFKTKNGYISVLPDGTVVPTVMEVAKTKGKNTGIVVTCSITHATPAVFYSHVSSRGNEAEIATFATNQTIDVFIGGGLSFFVPSTTHSATQEGYQEETKTEPKVQLNLLDTMRSLGYNIITNYGDFSKHNTKGFEKLLALLEPMHLPSVVSGNRRVSLSEMTKKSLEILSKSQKGFVLMIEGSQIDWEAHANNAKGIVAEMKDFDDTVGIVLDFAITNQDTLVIVTSDHETGGVGIIGGVVGKSTTIRFVSKDHTAELVPVFSYGPGSDQFVGIFDNTYIGKKLIEIVRN